MVERRTPLTRSEMMARIRSADTKPERLVRKGLHAARFRFRLHTRELPGSPDIVLRKHHCAIVVHCCFWHGHQECGNFRLPKTRPEFWSVKISANRARDQHARDALVNDGWRVLVVWECATRTIYVDRLIETIAAWLQGSETSAELSANGLSFLTAENSEIGSASRNQHNE